MISRYIIKVLVITPLYPFPEYKDGTRKIISNLLRYLSDRITIDVFTLYQKEDEKFFPEEKNFENWFEKHWFQQLTFKQTLWQWLFSKYPFNVVKFHSQFQPVAQYISENERNYDLIHLETPFLAPVMSYLPPGIWNKILIFPHDSMTLLTQRRIRWESSYLSKLLLYIDLKKVIGFESKYYTMYRRTVFVSRTDAEFVHSLNNKIEVNSIPNGVKVDYFKPSGRKPESNSIIFTGNMSYAPNSDAALFLVEKIYPLLKVKNNNIKLYLVGIGPGEKLRQHHDGKNIIITGFVQDIREYLESALLYVSPLRFGSGIKNKILEAMAMEKAVLGSRISFEGISPVDSEKEVLIERSFDETVWANTILRYLNQSDILAKIGKNARKLVQQNYSWGTICEQYRQLYKSCLTKR